MKCTELMECLEKLAPLSYACSWDNPGLLAGRGEKEISKILIALDATDEAVDMAEREGCDLLLTHHPLIFNPIKKVSDQDMTGRRLVRLIRADINCYSMHTNFDIAPGCMADLAGDMLGLANRVPLEKTGTDERTGKSYGIGLCGDLERDMDLKELALTVKERFGLPFVNVYGAGQCTGMVRKISICPGSGRGMAGRALALGARVLITGDIGHHEGIDAAAENLAVMDAGHYGLEHIFTDFMERYIRERIDGKLIIKKAPVSYPVTAW